MTLIELLVSTAILSLMILLFSMVLNSTQQVTSTAHATMRGNAAAAAIADVIRKNVARITKNGFLCITQTADDSPVLMFTTSGTTSSVTSNSVATEAVVMLGLCDNTAAQNSKVLWTKRMLLDPNAPPLVTDDDLWTDVGFQAQPDRVSVNTLITDSTTPGIDQEILTGIDVSTELDAYSGLWQVLAVDCEGLSITWTDGLDNNGDGQMDWYGIINQYDDTQTPPNDSVYVEEPGRAGWNVQAANNTLEEFDWTYPASVAVPGPLYRALWIRDDPVNWPRAIKISFVINDPDMPEQLQGKRYEIICPIRQ